MHNTQIPVFLLSLGVLFGCAKVAGGLVSRLGFPAVVGEILAGVLIGKTVLGRISPDTFDSLFGGTSATVMLQGYKLVAVVLLLAVAGLEIDGGLLRRRGRALVSTGIFSAVVPFAFGYGAGLLLPDQYLANPSERAFHALFFGIALAISALPVITRTLMDLGLLKTELGIMVLSAAVLDDLIGWVCFSALVREMGTTGESSGYGVLLSVGLTTGVVVVALVVLRPLVDVWLRILARADDERPPTARALSMIMILAMFGAAATESLGIHAVFGGFIVGLAIGRSPHLHEQTRHALQDCVTSLFTPIFFSTMALRHDFIASFDTVLVLIVLTVAIIAKVAGSALGARLAGIPGPQAWAIGFGLNSRGAMEILLASIALDAKMINEKMFVALIVMAIITSLISGPAMAWILGRAPSSLEPRQRRPGAVMTHAAPQ